MKNIQKALMTGVSYMLPFIVVSGLCIGFTGVIQTYFSVESQLLALLNGFAWTVLGLIPAIFAAYTAFAIADKPGICAGFIGGYIASHPILESTKASGFLGALVAGIIAGYLVKWLKKMPFPKVIDALKSSIVIPLISALVIYFIMAYPVGVAFGWLNDAIINGLLVLSANTTLAFLLGAILSAMIAIDMGGPLGKIAITFVFAVWADPSGLGFMVNAAVFPGIMVPPLAVGIAALLAPKKFTSSERKSAPTAILTGLVGITEATLPYAFRDPIRVIVCNVIGSAVGGAMMLALRISSPGVSGIIGIPPASNPLMFIVCVVVGVAISTVLLLVVKKPVQESETLSEQELDLEINFN